MYQSIRSTIVPMRSETSATKSLGSQRSHLILLAMAGFFTVHALATPSAHTANMAIASGGVNADPCAYAVSTAVPAPLRKLAAGVLIFSK